MSTASQLAALIAPFLENLLWELLDGLAGLLLLALLLLLAIYLVLRKMGVRFASGRGGTISFQMNLTNTKPGKLTFENVTVEHARPEVHRLDNAAIQQAAGFLRQGLDLDTVCRYIEPAYSGWDPFRQQAFRSVMQEVLKNPPPSPQETK